MRLFDVKSLLVGGVVVGAVCMVMAPLAYEEADYIRAPGDFFIG